MLHKSLELLLTGIEALPSPSLQDAQTLPVEDIGWGRLSAVGSVYLAYFSLLELLDSPDLPENQRPALENILLKSEKILKEAAVAKPLYALVDILLSSRRIISVEELHSLLEKHPVTFFDDRIASLPTLLKMVDSLYGEDLIHKAYKGEVLEFVYINPAFLDPDQREVLELSALENLESINQTHADKIARFTQLTQIEVKFTYKNASLSKNGRTVKLSRSAAGVFAILISHYQSVAPAPIFEFGWGSNKGVYFIEIREALSEVNKGSELALDVYGFGQGVHGLLEVNSTTGTPKTEHLLEGSKYERSLTIGDQELRYFDVGNMIIFKLVTPENPDTIITLVSNQAAIWRLFTQQLGQVVPFNWFPSEVSIGFDINKIRKECDKLFEVYGLDIFNEKNVGYGLRILRPNETRKKPRQNTSSTTPITRRRRGKLEKKQSSIVRKDSQPLPISAEVAQHLARRIVENPDFSLSITQLETAEHVTQLGLDVLMWSLLSPYKNTDSVSYLANNILYNKLVAEYDLSEIQIKALRRLSISSRPVTREELAHTLVCEPEQATGVMLFLQQQIGDHIIQVSGDDRYNLNWGQLNEETLSWESMISQNTVKELPFAVDHLDETHRKILLNVHTHTPRTIDQVARDNGYKNLLEFLKVKKAIETELGFNPFILKNWAVYLTNPTDSIQLEMIEIDDLEADQPDLPINWQQLSEFGIELLRFLAEQENPPLLDEVAKYFNVGFNELLQEIQDIETQLGAAIFSLSNNQVLLREEPPAEAIKLPNLPDYNFEPGSRVVKFNELVTLVSGPTETVIVNTRREIFTVLTGYQKKFFDFSLQHYGELLTGHRLFVELGADPTTQAHTIYNMTTRLTEKFEELFAEEDSSFIFKKSLGKQSCLVWAKKELAHEVPVEWIASADVTIPNLRVAIKKTGDHYTLIRYDQRMLPVKDIQLSFNESVFLGLLLEEFGRYTDHQKFNQAAEERGTNPLNWRYNLTVDLKKALKELFDETEDEVIVLINDEELGGLGIFVANREETRIDYSSYFADKTNVKRDFFKQTPLEYVVVNQLKTLIHCKGEYVLLLESQRKLFSLFIEKKGGFSSLETIYAKLELDPTDKKSLSTASKAVAALAQNLDTLSSLRSEVALHSIQKVGYGLFEKVEENGESFINLDRYFEAADLLIPGSPVEIAYVEGWRFLRNGHRFAQLSKLEDTLITYLIQNGYHATTLELTEVLNPVDPEKPDEPRTITKPKSPAESFRDKLKKLEPLDPPIVLSADKTSGYILEVK